jgi:MoxR-like ATPase
MDVSPRLVPDGSRVAARTSIDEMQQSLLRGGYLADRGLATVLSLALALQRPVLLEGEAGVGKTEVAKCLSEVRSAQLIRLQCYEGIDVNQALYEWDYTRQLLHIRMLSEQGERQDVAELFGPEFLLERPLLQALRLGPQSVLLIDEIDRADDEFEAFLLEVLSDFQVSIPEIGTIKAAEPPIVILTSNRTRELHDALRRRCLFHWIDYPDFEREVEIVKVRAPEVPDQLARQVVKAVGLIREMHLLKQPGVAETLDWARALQYLGADLLDEELIALTVGVVAKERDDAAKVSQSLGQLPGRPCVPGGLPACDTCGSDCA